jgi:hypothetical protein
VYDDVLREKLIMVWEASDRLCGKRLKALAHPVAVAASIDLDSAGTPRKVNAPFGLLRTGYQGAR